MRTVARKAALLAVLALLGLPLAGCEALFVPVPASTPSQADEQEAWSPQEVRLAVCWAALPLAEELRAAYTGYRAGVTIEIAAMSSALAHELAAAGQVDLAIVAAPDEETVRAWQPTLPWRRLARDGLAIIVHRDRPLSQIAVHDLAALYAGQVADWSALGAGQGAPQFLIQGDDTTARHVFDAAVMAEQELSTAARILPHDEAVLAFVSEHPDAIGYLSAAYLGRDGRAKAVSLDGLLPTRPQLEAGDYSLAYELFIAQAPQASEEAARLEEFALGRLGRELIGERYGLPR